MSENLNAADCKILIDKTLKDIGLQNSSKSILLEKYIKLLLAGYNKRRVTGEKSYHDLLSKQIYDSLYLLRCLKVKNGDRIIDLGSGGGLPGIPLKIFLENQKFILLDANIHKVGFLKNAIRELALANTEVVYGRSEEFAHQEMYREKFDFLVSKAVAEMAVLAELALPFIKQGGSAYFYKGPQGEEELEKALHAIALCGGQHIETYYYRLAGGEERFIYRINKISATPLQYPRAPGKPAQRPLIIN